MRTNLRHIVFILTVGLGLVVASCDKSPTRPSVQPTGTPAAPAAVTVARIEIIDEDRVLAMTGVFRALLNVHVPMLRELPHSLYVVW